MMVRERAAMTTVRTLWTLQRDDLRLRASLEDFGVNGVEVSVLDAAGSATVTERFTTVSLAEEWANAERDRLGRDGWRDVSDE